jgi:3-phosphoshikimate 1-carboxyvinyltransferase
MAKSPRGKISSMKIRRARRIVGRTHLPGDKSISHRAAVIAALATGKSNITNFSTSADCASTLSCLSSLGVAIDQEGTSARIQGAGRSGFNAPSKQLDCGNSGSTLRMMAGVLAGQNFQSILTGDESLRSRPMKRIIEPLELMGAHVFSENGKAPLRIEGCNPLTAIRYQLPVASAQVKSSVLLAGLNAVGRTEVVEPQGIITRDHTERMLKWFGVRVENGDENSTAASCSVVGPARFSGHEVRIPGDFSSAAYLIAAAAMMPGSELEIENLGLNPTRTQFLHVLRSSGAGIEVVTEREDCNEPVGIVSVRGPGRWRPWKEFSGAIVASLIDELPLLAVVGTQIPGGIVIRDAAELRTKESDRIAATVSNLRAMGAKVEKHDDGLAVDGPVPLHGATLDSYGDHRIAMAFTVAALIARGDSEILGSDCVEISFPGFFECLESLVER